MAVRIHKLKEALLGLFEKEGWAQYRKGLFKKELDGKIFRFRMMAKKLRYEQFIPETKKWKHIGSGFFGKIDIVDGIIQGLQEPTKVLQGFMKKVTEAAKGEKTTETTE